MWHLLYRPGCILHLTEVSCFCFPNTWIKGMHHHTWHVILNPEQCLLFNINDFWFMCMNFFCMCMCAPHACIALRDQKRASDPKTGIRDGFELPCGVWEMIDPSLLPLSIALFLFYVILIYKIQDFWVLGGFFFVLGRITRWP